MAFFKTMTDSALRTEYVAWRTLAHNNAAMAASGAVNVRKCAYSMGTIMRNVQIIEAIARNRRIRLTA